MKQNSVMKKCLWIMLTILISLVVLQAGCNASENIRIFGEPTFHDYVAQAWEILKGIAAFVPVWLLTLLGLARSFWGENWFPFAEKIPVRLTKTVLIASGILLAGVSVAGELYSEFAKADYRVQYRMEARFEAWRTIFAWILFYSILLYIEQWCLRREDSRKNIRKKQIWASATAFLLLLILMELSCVALWYLPLDYVDSPNRLEDYYLWWFSLYLAVFFLPLWFFAARKTVRLFKNEKWLTLSDMVPKKLTGFIALLSCAMMVWETREFLSATSWIPYSEVPEYTEARAMSHIFPAMLWGLLLIYTICLLVKQIRKARQAKHQP